MDNTPFSLVHTPSNRERPDCYNSRKPRLVSQGDRL